MWDRLALGWLLATLPPHLAPQRMWLERLALIIPGPAASRWLLLADAACLIAIALGSSRPRAAVPLILGLGFLAVNVAGMVLNDFYLGLALVHLAAACSALLLARRRRWVGVAALSLTLALGMLT
jgi:hypothetical protein